MENFISSGRYTQGCIVPITSEDPSLTVLETKDDTKKWGIAIFIGKPIAENCIGLINDESLASTVIHSSILTMTVVKNNEYVGSVGQRIANRISLGE